jgi:hypothetical protein
MPAISQEDLDECIQLVHSRWSQEYDLLKAVKNERSDGSKDWLLFHAERLKNHTEYEAKWNAIRLRLQPLHSFVTLGRPLGNKP